MVLNEGIHQTQALFFPDIRKGGKRSLSPGGKGIIPHLGQGVKCFSRNGHAPGTIGLPSPSVAAIRAEDTARFNLKISGRPGCKIFPANGATAKIKGVALVKSQAGPEQKRQGRGRGILFLEYLQNTGEQGMGFGSSFRSHPEGFQKLAAILGQTETTPISANPSWAVEQHAFLKGKIHVFP